MISYWPFKEKIVPIPCLSECIEGLKMWGALSDKSPSGLSEAISRSIGSIPLPSPKTTYMQLRRTV